MISRHEPSRKGSAGMKRNFARKMGPTASPERSQAKMTTWKVQPIGPVIQPALWGGLTRFGVLIADFPP